MDNERDREKNRSVHGVCRVPVRGVARASSRLTGHAKYIRHSVGNWPAAIGNSEKFDTDSPVFLHPLRLFFLSRTRRIQCQLVRSLARRSLVPSLECLARPSGSLAHGAPGEAFAAAPRINLLGTELIRMNSPADSTGFVAARSRCCAAMQVKRNIRRINPLRTSVDVSAR